MTTDAPSLRRVVVLGTSGSGKTMLAQALARLLGVRPLELDELAQGPNWVQVPAAELAARVAELTAGSAWVVDGNYIDKVGDLLWPRADTIIWLDLPLRVILPRLIRRSLRRIRHRTALYNGNQETWRALLGRDSVLTWAVQSQRRHTRELPGRLAALSRTGTYVVRLRSAAEVDSWRAGLPAVVAASGPHLGTYRA